VGGLHLEMKRLCQIFGVSFCVSYFSRRMATTVLMLMAPQPC
jgi:hypothetical protein